MLRIFGLALVSAAPIWLAACMTVPTPLAVDSTAAINRAVAPAPTEAVAIPAAPAALSGPPADAVLEDPVTPASPKLRPALLTGEPAREFERGGASWYGPGFHGRRTASGEKYDMNAFTAAHRTLPFGTWVRVHSLTNGREVDVRITDRGPFIRSRVIDVSRAAAASLGMLGLGFKEVVLSVPESTPAVADASSLAKTLRRGAGRAPKTANADKPTVHHKR